MIRPGWLLGSLTWAALLGLRSYWPGDDGRFWDLVAEARFGGVSWAFASSALRVALLAALPWTLLGALCRMSVERRVAGFVGAPVALVLAWLLAAVAEGFRVPGEWRAPVALELLPAATACLIGVVLGGAFQQRAPRMLPSLAWRITLLATAAGFGVVALAAKVLDERPPDAPAASVTSDQKRTLVGKLRRHNPLELGAGQREVLEFSPDELRTLLAWGALLVDSNARVAVRPQGDALAWLASVHLPVGLGARRQLSVQGNLALASGPAGLVVERCVLAVGALRITPWLCSSSVHSLYRFTRENRDIGALAAAIQSLRIDNAGLAASYVRPDIDSDARLRLQQALGPGSEIRAAARAQFDVLRRGAALAGGDDRFAAVLRVAFELARSRSANGSAVAQNQGAILALATILGHHEIASLAGIERPLDWRAIRDVWWPAPLRGRQDWSRHFLVSAGLTQISTAVVSDAAGLLKEELDAAQRSGFSFGDLLADRAGTRFGELAARDEATARALQAALVDRFRPNDLMPPGDDLPERLTDAEFQRRFGGVGGPGYRELVADIEARVAQLPGF